MQISESRIAQYRLKGSLETVHAVIQKPRTTEEIKQLIQNQREPLLDQLDTFAISDAAHLDTARASSISNSSYSTALNAEDKRNTIHTAIGEMQALHDLAGPGITSQDLHQKYQRELKTLESAAGPISVKNSMWNVGDRVILPIEPLQRGYDLVQDVTPAERKRLNANRGARYLDDRLFGHDIQDQMLDPAFHNQVFDQTIEMQQPVMPTPDPLAAAPTLSPHEQVRNTRRVMALLPANYRPQSPSHAA